ncbi:MAG TPA: glycerophosphodiester phosphodiesterase family protein, partial [Methylocella sp.]|nr:glycerophosphodiester phosphodiesterase family protein [Methylocella sp.]
MTKPEINAPDWLTARPIAHRGLHSRLGGAAENTLAAASAAIARNYAIECDVRRSKDGKAIVFHDETLDRLTQASGPVGAFSAAALEGIPYKNFSQNKN